MLPLGPKKYTLPSDVATMLWLPTGMIGPVIGAEKLISPQPSNSLPSNPYAKTRNSVGTNIASNPFICVTDGVCVAASGKDTETPGKGYHAVSKRYKRLRSVTSTIDRSGNCCISPTTRPENTTDHIFVPEG